MLALEVHINGQKRYTAGFLSDGVVTAILSCVSRRHEAKLRVGGLDSEHHEFVEWPQPSDLGVGDEVLLRVVDVPNIDSPVESSRKPQDERRHKDYLLQMAKQFGWKIDTGDDVA